MAGVAELTGTVKYYDWGGFSFIPSLLNTPNKEEKTFAEYWLGVHPQSDCRVGGQLLRDIIHNEGQAVLGPAVYERFGTMPFLLKVLDVKKMLSIQVHPAKADAVKGFERENKDGIPAGSPTRNYKDDNHKPELIVALGEFWLLHGFRAPEEMEQVMIAVPELSSLLPVFRQSGYKGLYSAVMEMPQDKVNEQLDPLLQRIIPQYHSGKLDKANPDYWAAKAALTFSRPGKTDRGIFSVYLFNLLRLDKGQAIFQDAGVPHAYLEGQNVEIMASSDNVLRGGLTTKHIDVKELLAHVKCEATHPHILEGTQSGDEKIYPTTAPDFELGSFTIDKNSKASFRPVTTEILLLIKGEVEISDGTNKTILRKGSPSAVVFPGKDKVQLFARESSLVYRATVP
jgi:mannose-6-phosphate isomerase